MVAVLRSIFEYLIGFNSVTGHSYSRENKPSLRKRPSTLGTAWRPNVVTLGREGQLYPSLLLRWMNDAAVAERSSADKINVDMKTQNVAPSLKTLCGIYLFINSLPLYN